MLDGQRLSPGAMLAALNRVGGRARDGTSGSGREPLGGHEVPRLLRDAGRPLLLKAHRAIESLTLNREVAHLKDELMPRYASLIYNGYWFSPERRMCKR